ncbi:ABC transporter permease [Geothermobacter hydrogeniphilus]|uniref:Transport permease protein n=1 Tax=Geothermobacter hydrogeniphilus TaxID=1969733 RepID=A0A1X0YAI4_9BACT|nr:ABC transporter permease [Geothermobacter hydrogeniphilus]ORJ62127.1 ABC transporter permease [Geothermobacter hydrogeniphilus]
MLNGVRGIYLREILILRRKLVKTVLSAAVSPGLFLIAFGYGIGSNARVDGLSYLAFLLPGLLTMSSMNQSYGIATEINIARFYFKVFEEYLLAPIRRWEIVVGEMSYGITRGLIPVLVIACYSLLCGVQLHFGPLFLLALLLHLGIFALLGLVVALLVRNHSDQATMNAFLITPIMFLSGTFFPVAQMPLPVRLLAALSPLTYSTRLIRSTLLPGAAVETGLFPVLLIMLVGLFLLAGRVVARVQA